MENASKALIIAGEILIAMLILSIGVYLVNSTRRVPEAYEHQMSQLEIVKFNSFFLHFEERGSGATKGVSAQEIASVINYAQEFNDNMDELLIIIWVDDAPAGNGWNGRNSKL